MSVLLKATNICKRYSSNANRFELKPTSITLEKGIIYVIKGKSGSGKSTLLNIIGGMDCPSSGSVSFNNKSFYELSDHEQSKIRSEKYGFIFQSFNLVPELTVKENIELPKYLNKSLHIDAAKISDIASELGIKALLHHKPSQLSGGEQQRVGIARALITSPEIIFADEPTGNLDSFNTKIIADMLVNVVLTRNTTLVIVTHEENLIDHHHIKLRMHDGELLLEDVHV